MSDRFTPLGAKMDTDIDDLINSFDGEWIGRVIEGRYRILKELAEGGMGTVYIAQHLTLGKEVALKIIHPELAGDDELAERFAREAMATAQLDHPHVASAMDYGKLPEGGAYLVMQLVRGPSLQDVLETQGRVPWARVCAIGAQVADALSAAHAHGIIHRDLKPENVMLVPRDDGSELVKVLDFGIARLSDDKMNPVGRRSRLTRRGTVMGTPGYMSPEQALGEQIDERADIYALGTLMWESMVGRTLWEGDTLTDIVQSQLSEDLTPRLAKEAEDPTVPEELQALVDAMLAHHADDRPTKASEVRDALRQLTLKATVEATGGNLTPPMGVPRQDPKTAPTMAGHFNEQPKTPWKLLIVGLVSALALVAVIVVVASLDDGPSEEEEAALIERIREEAELATRMQELERQTGLLMNEESQGIRRAAATYVLDFEPADQVQLWVLSLAHLELAGDCQEWGAALDEVVEVGDPRVLQRVDRRFPTGWRRGMRRDPYRCVRAKITEIVDGLNPEGE